MGFNKKLMSKKAVEVEYWRLDSLALSSDGTLRMIVNGYKDGVVYDDGADPIETYECVINNADTFLKTPFYDLLEQ